MRLLLFLPFLTGCTPYVFGGLGYGLDGGDYYEQGIKTNEQGALGTYGVGIEFRGNVACEYRHRSLLDKQPEFVTNDIVCEKTFFFGARQ